MARIFVSAPYTHTYEKGFLAGLSEFLRQLGCEVIVPHDYVGTFATLQDEIEKDFEFLDSCDTIIAEVSQPSHGVGAEVWHSAKSGKRIILIRKPGSKLSGVLEAVAGEIIDYELEDDLKEKLAGLLSASP